MKSKKTTIFLVSLLFFTVLISFLYFVLQKNTLENQERIVSPTRPETTESFISPTPIFYTVVKGDTLWSIAEKIYNDASRWTDIARANNITKRTELRMGTRLILTSSNGLVQGTNHIKKNKRAIPTQIATASYPAQVLNLVNWKLTLPLPGSSDDPKEIKQPELATYAISPWFIVAPGGGVRFRAPVNSVTTSGSSYPRSELREMTNNGKDKASWSSNSGTHTMLLDQAITAVPQKKQHVVAGQIHDADDDIIVIRLEYPTLYVNVDGKNVYTLDSDYTLGKRFTILFVVSANETKVYYNNSIAPVHTLNKEYPEAYFKAGAYTQSNCSREGASLCNENNYGEVIVYQTIVTHQ